MNKIIFSISVLLIIPNISWADLGEKPMSLTPPPLVIEAPKLSRQDNANLHLSIIRDETDQMKENSFMDNLFSTSSEIQDTLVQDVDLFLAVFSDLKVASEALFIKGQLQQKQGNEEDAAVTWLQILYEYPGADIENTTQQHLTALIEKDLKKFEEVLQPISKKVSQDSDKATRITKLIRQLYPINDTNITKALITLQLDFLSRFPDDIHADEIQVLLAHNLGADSAESGVYGFKKLLALYPNSFYRPESMLAVADLQRNRLRTYDKATKNYTLLIQEYPKHTLAKNAYKNLALTYEENLKQYQDAIKTYDTIVALYPKDKVALNALQHIATLQERKTNQVPESIATLRKLATMFHGTEAPQALDHAITLADKKLKDAMLTLAIREELLRKYPDSEEAPQAMYEMGVYAEEVEKDPTKARDIYQKFVLKYPEHKLAKRAAKRLRI